jgi:uncharacterized protein
MAMFEPDFEQARRYALQRLERELDPAFCYHSVAHTRDDVAPAAERLAALEGVAGEQLLLLRTAAYFHDIGFVERREGHEAAGAQIAAACLPTFGYSQEQAATVGRLILATRLPQSPQNLTEAILADSDLDLLGRDDFLQLNQQLHKELGAFGEPTGNLEWYRQQGAFLRGHRYWTRSARALREPGKQRNIQALDSLLAVSEAATSRR